LHIFLGRFLFIRTTATNVYEQHARSEALLARGDARNEKELRSRDSFKEYLEKKLKEVLKNKK